MEPITYEHFIRRGYKCDRYGRKGADVDIFDSFARVSYEYNQDASNKKIAKDFEKRISEIKHYMAGALNHSLKRVGGNQQAVADIQDLINRTNTATNKTDLEGIITDGISTFNTYGIKMS